MSKILSQAIQNQLNSKEVKVKFKLYINNQEFSNYLVSWQLSYSMEYGSASANFSLLNDEGLFGDAGQYKLNVGDVVSFTEYFDGDATEFPKFYGIINQRSITKSADARQIQLVCLDYISVLQFWDIDFDAEGTKTLIEEEKLTPHYLPEPNQSLAQVFDFANNAISSSPTPVLMIRGKDSSFSELAFDGFEIKYENGQVKLGYPINALYNYDVYARSYYFYTNGLYAEDIIEQLLTKPNGYGDYLFGETSSQAVIDNHLTTTFNATEGRTTDYLTPNYTTSTVAIKHRLASDIVAATDRIYLDSVDGLPTSGTASINGDIFTWSSIESGNCLAGIPTSGTYALKAHKYGSYLKYERDYPPGTVWYLSYSNVLSDLTSSDFTIPSGETVAYFDKRFGRIILANQISITNEPTCDVDYTFKTLQASGIEINKIQFRAREIENRFEAIKKLFSYLAPNYKVRTVGDAKIWASYLYQKVNEDYTLQLATQLNYLEDDDLYTRTVFYGKNNNPFNLMFADGVQFETTGQSYKALASNTELSLLAEDASYYTYGITSSVSTSGESSDATKGPETVVSYTSGVGAIAWADVDKAKYADGVGATCALTSQTSEYLKLTNFGFTIPSAVTIKGITVTVNKKGTGIKDSSVRLLRNGSIIGDQKAKLNDNWTDSYSVSLYGSPTSIWGVNWLPEDINSSNFGVVISAVGTGTANIDYVTIMVTYTAGGSTTTSSIGQITTNSVIPKVYINGIPVDSQAHKIVGQQILLETTTRTETTSGGGK